MTAKKKNELTVKGGEGIIAIDVEGQVLNVVDPNVEKMFVEPLPHHGTAIALLLSRCIVPIQMNVFGIPEMLLQRIEEEAENAEKMMPVKMVEIKYEISLFKSELAGLASSIVNKDRIGMFVADAVAKSGTIAHDYLVSVLELCESVSEFKKSHASSDAYYQKQTLGDDAIEFDASSVIVSIQNHILDMNKMSAGWGGHRIMALLKTIDQTAKLLDNEQIKSLFGATDVLSMLNSLHFRIQPDQMAFSKNLCELAEIVAQIGEKKVVDKITIGKLIRVCNGIKSYNS